MESTALLPRKYKLTEMPHFREHRPVVKTNTLMEFQLKPTLFILAQTDTPFVQIPLQYQLFPAL